MTTLEAENKSLMAEVLQITEQSDEMEESERRLIEDLHQQLSTRTLEFDSLSLELDRYKEENRLQHDEIMSLSKRLSDTEMRLHSLSTESEETSSILCITKENQDLLAHELTEFKSRYAETLALLHETQDLLRKQLKKSMPSVRSSLIPIANPYFANDSLQSELMDSLDSGILSDPGIPRTYKNVCDTMKFVQNSGKEKSPSDGLSQIGSMAMSTVSSQPRICSTIFSGGDPFYSTIYAPVKMETIVQDEYPAKSQIGMPGTVRV